ncbi:hypothetical protein ACS0TY_029637 [Phlomoides rotata]
MQLQRWVPDFNPYWVNSLIALAWVRLFKIPIEYFHEEFISALASAIGPVIKIDKCTHNKTMCHFARVLVEIDLKHELDECIMF